MSYNYKRYQIIGQKIYGLRRSFGLSLDDLSDLINVSSETLQRYENDVEILPISHLINILDVFNKNINYFYESPSEEINLYEFSCNIINNIEFITLEEDRTNNNFDGY